MKIEEIYLLTAFACSACDGEIAKEEIEQIKKFTIESNMFGGIDVSERLNSYVDDINNNGIAFINNYISILENCNFSDEEQLKIIEIAILTIEADNQILYPEIKFFKKLRRTLPISDEKILDIFPDKEDYLLPDINMPDFDFDSNINFEPISFSLNDEKSE